MAERQSLLEENLGDSKRVIDEYRQERERFLIVEEDLKVREGQIQGTNFEDFANNYQILI
jgi:hypothetical protein